MSILRRARHFQRRTPKVGDEVVWFLTYRPDAELFNFAAGAFAAFRISGDQVVALTEEEDGVTRR
jgi:hypothetical protein